MMAAPITKVLPKDIVTVDRVLTGREQLWRDYGHQATQFAVNLLVAALILVVTLWAAHWVSGLVGRALKRVHHRRTGETDVTLQTFGASLARYIVIIIGLVAVLEQLGVQATSVLAVLGAASIAIGLALQGALSNVAAGVMLLLFRPYRVGDLIETGGRQGVVKALDLFVTELATPDNLKLVVPNGKVFGETIINYSGHARRRVDVVFHIDPKRDLAAVLEAMKAVVVADKRILKDPEALFEAVSLNELYAEGAVRAWVKAADYAKVKTQLVLAVQRLSAAQAALPVAEPPPASPAQG
jgi:small conductance mechanosensitive channel